MTSNSNIFDIIRAPLITEKSHLRATENKYSFFVQPDATKAAVKEAVEKIFNVTVNKVNTLNRKGKSKRFRGTLGKRNNVKIAIATLKPGDSIDFEGGA
jgi:large subunit ribosomal protein L23